MVNEIGIGITPVDKLAMFREQVRSEPDTKSKMSEQAAARLRQINEHDKSEKAANQRFVEWFSKQNVTVEFLMDLMWRVTRGDVSEAGQDRYDQRRKRAVKCAHMFQHWGNTTVREPHDIMFLGELLPEERHMSLSQVMRRYPVDEDKPIYTPPQLEEKPVRRCALGRKCLRAKHNRAAEVTGTAAYCSDNCRGRAKMQTRLANTSAAQPN